VRRIDSPPFWSAPLQNESLTGRAAKASVRIIIRCRSCGRQADPDPSELAARYGAESSVLDWRERLICSRYGRHSTKSAARLPAAFKTRRNSSAAALAARAAHGRVSDRKIAARCPDVPSDQIEC
jgi:hypothetical protein